MTRFVEDGVLDGFAAKPGIERGRAAIELVLRSPRSWAVALPDHASAVAARAERWFRARGVIHDDATARKFTELAVAEYANWPFATAATDEAEVITAFGRRAGIDVVGDVTAVAGLAEPRRMAGTCPAISAP